MDELKDARETLARMTPGWWEVEQTGDSWRVINQAGYTHQVPLIVAEGLTQENAEAMAFCHNRLPQILERLSVHSAGGL